ncbi:MAG: EamA family transporter [Chloroflexi bacterium]|nr:EamA family transporter [Chloroflexota bacterium]
MRIFILLAINIISSVAGQLLLKLGMRNAGGFALDTIQRDPLVLIRILLNPFVFIGLVLYVVNVFLWFDIISKSDLSYVYPFLSMSYAAVVFASWLVLGESLTWQRVVGVGIISVGVWIVAQG